MIQQQTPEIKTMTGSTGLMILVVGLEIIALVLTYLTGAILVPWFLYLLQWAWLHLVHRLHSDLWLFLSLIFWTIGVLILLARALFSDTSSPFKKDADVGLDFLIGVGTVTIVLAILCAMFEKFFGQPAILGFIQPVTLTLFPDLRLVAQYPNRTTGLIWICYYLIAHLWSLRKPIAKNSVQQLPLARISPTSPKDEHIKQCFQHLSNALMAWDEPLIKNINWPVINYYHSPNMNDTLFWKGRILVVPEHLLNPTQVENFLPRLAREVARYNGPDLWLWQVFHAYPRHSGLLIFTGNWLWLPTLVQTYLYKRWRGERTLSLDIFVHFAGQNAWLQHDLRKQRYEIQQVGGIETSWPPLMERIDQLEALEKIEQAQIHNQGIIKAPLPLAPGKKTRKKTSN
jgi:hypothetical protein